MEHSQQKVVVVVAIKRLLAICLISLPSLGWTAVLPEETADIGWHYYSGDNVNVDGPALLVRKNLLNQFSIEASHTEDNVSCASVDVVSQASKQKFTDKRTENDASFTYLQGDSRISVSTMLSTESDYDSKTVGLNISQDVLNGMSTVLLGVSRGWDEVRRNDTDFKQDLDRHSVKMGLSQVLTRKLVGNFVYELINDDGYLANPYRGAIVMGAPIANEVVPASRTSHAFGFSSVYYLDPRAAFKASYRYYQDTWDIKSHTLGFGYAKPVTPDIIAEVRYRFYTQDKASFYQDDAAFLTKYISRDKELSTYHDHGLGVVLTYDMNAFKPNSLSKLTGTASWDTIQFSYDDFTNPRNGKDFSFTAQVIQFSLSGWY